MGCPKSYEDLAQKLGHTEGYSSGMRRGHHNPYHYNAMVKAESPWCETDAWEETLDNQCGSQDKNCPACVKKLCNAYQTQNKCKLLSGCPVDHCRPSGGGGGKTKRDGCDAAPACKKDKAGDLKCCDTACGTGSAICIQACDNALGILRGGTSLILLTLVPEAAETPKRVVTSLGVCPAAKSLSMLLENVNAALAVVSLTTTCKVVAQHLRVGK